VHCIITSTYYVTSRLFLKLLPKLILKLLSKLLPSQANVALFLLG
jgi:hypothetical protein